MMGGGLGNIIIRFRSGEAGVLWGRWKGFVCALTDCELFRETSMGMSLYVVLSKKKKRKCIFLQSITINLSFVMAGI